MIEYLVDWGSKTKHANHLAWAIDKVLSKASTDVWVEIRTILKGCPYLHSEKTKNKIKKAYYWNIPEDMWAKDDIIRLVFIAQAESLQSFYGEDSYTRHLGTWGIAEAEVPPDGDSDEAAWKVLDRYARNIKVNYLDYGKWVYCIKALLRFLQGELELEVKNKREAS